MREKTKGQSLVEMGLLLPFMLVIFFGIIDMGYIIFSYATVYQAAREGAEQASIAPPLTENVQPRTFTISRNADDCITAIIERVENTAVMFQSDIGEHVIIAYPEYRRYRASDPIPAGFNVGDPVPPELRRNLGYPIEVSITYPIQSLTPVWAFVPLGDSGVFTISTTARRTIDGLGRDPSGEQLVGCAPDVTTP